MSYLVLRGCNIIAFNVPVPTEGKCVDSDDSIQDELEEGFDYFPKYIMKNLLGDFNEKLGTEDTFKPTIGNESLHQDSNYNGVQIAKFAT